MLEKQNIEYKPVQESEKEETFLINVEINNSSDMKKLKELIEVL